MKYKFAHQNKKVKLFVKLKKTKELRLEQNKKYLLTLPKDKIYTWMNFIFVIKNNLKYTFSLLLDERLKRFIKVIKMKKLHKLVHFNKDI